MYDFDPQAIAAVAIPIGGAVIWLLRLEGRVNLHDSSIKDIKGDLLYIRQRIDHALNGRRHDD